MTDGKKFPKAPEGTEWYVTIERSQREGNWVRVRLMNDTFSGVTLAFKRYRLPSDASPGITRFCAIVAAEDALEDYAKGEADQALAEALTEEANGRPVIPS